MSLWAVAKIEVKNPKTVNIKDIINKMMYSNYRSYMDETIIDSLYSRSSGVEINIRSTYTGETFDHMIHDIVKTLKKENVGQYFIQVDQNYYY